MRLFQTFQQIGELACQPRVVPPPLNPMVFGFIVGDRVMAFLNTKGKVRKVLTKTHSVLARHHIGHHTCKISLKTKHHQINRRAYIGFWVNRHVRIQIQIARINILHRNV